MFESAEIGHKLKKAEFKREEPKLRQRLLDLQYRLLDNGKFPVILVVNGVDVSMMGSRFYALYLPPPSRPEKPLTVKTLIVPSSEYADGRNLILTTGHSVYTIALRHLVEQRADWSWAAFQIIDKKPTDY